MADDIEIPSYQAPILTAAQVGQVMGRQRPTIAGWLHRYDWLAASPTAPGAIRMFSCADIGRLTALRMAISAGNLMDALGESLDLVEPAIASEFDELFSAVRHERWGKAGELRPYLPASDQPLRLTCDGTGGGMLFPHKSISDGKGSLLMDLAGFQLPETTIHLGQGLRNAWNRSLFIINGFGLDD